MLTLSNNDANPNPEQIFLQFFQLIADLMVLLVWLSKMPRSVQRISPTSVLTIKSIKWSWELELTNCKSISVIEQWYSKLLNEILKKYTFVHKYNIFWKEYKKFYEAHIMQIKIAHCFRNICKKVSEFSQKKYMQII